VFYAESMYSHRPQASKVALLALCRQWQAWGLSLIDVQMETEHLLGLGAVCMSRAEFERLLAKALSLPAPAADWRRNWSLTAPAQVIFAAPAMDPGHAI
jgi:leucyl/phenylalanyl-tRNA--protein transferase